MNYLIEKLLKKRKVKFEELDEDEKETFDKWQKILSEDISLETLNDFCEAQKEVIENNYTNPDNTREKDLVLKATLAVYKSILGLINGQKVERVALVKYLENLIK